MTDLQTKEVLNGFYYFFIYLFFLFFLTKMYIFLEKFQIFQKLATNCYMEKEFDKNMTQKLK